MPLFFSGGAGRARKRSSPASRGWKPLPPFINPHKFPSLLYRQYNMWERHLAAIRLSTTRNKATGKGDIARAPQLSPFLQYLIDQLPIRLFAEVLHY
jgi:hypothetical protein